MSLYFYHHNNLKVKEFFQEKCNTAAASSGIGESGFDASENLSGDLPGDLPVNLPADFVAEERIEEAQFKMNRRSLKNRHTLATVEHSTPAAKSPKTDDFMRVTATVRKKVSPQNGSYLFSPSSTIDIRSINLSTSLF